MTKKIIISESQYKRLMESIEEPRVSPKTIKKWQKFNDDLNAFYQFSETDCIYEDAFTPRYVKNFNLDLDGTLTYEEYLETWGVGKINKSEEMMYDDEEALDWLKDFKKWLNKAKKYYATNAETLDGIHDGQIEDIVESINPSNQVDSACSYIFCLDENGEWNLLVGRRTSTSLEGANRYNPPMGMTEDGESSLETAVRECFEETGLRLNPTLFQYYDKESWGQGKIGINYVAVLDGDISDYNTTNGDGENDKFFWLPISKINTLSFAFGTNEKALEIFTKLGL